MIASPQKFVTIHGGNSLAQFRSLRVNATVKRKELGLPPEGPIIGTVGRLVPIKGHTWLLRAVPQVLAEFPQACVVLIGDGPLLGELKELAADLGISQHVVFLGTRHDIPECLAVLDLFSTNRYDVFWRRVPANNEIREDQQAFMAAYERGTARELSPPRRRVRPGSRRRGAHARGGGDRLGAAAGQGAQPIAARDRSRGAAYGEAAGRYVDGRFDIETMVHNIERLYDEVWQEKHPAT